jgi:hypothetical protein
VRREADPRSRELRRGRHGAKLATDTPSLRFHLRQGYDVTSRRGRHSRRYKCSLMHRKPAYDVRPIIVMEKGSAQEKIGFEGRMGSGLNPEIIREHGI